MLFKNKVNYWGFYHSLFNTDHSEIMNKNTSPLNHLALALPGRYRNPTLTTNRQKIWILVKLNTTQCTVIKDITRSLESDHGFTSPFLKYKLKAYL